MMPQRESRRRSPELIVGLVVGALVAIAVAMFVVALNSRPDGPAESAPGGSAASPASPPTSPPTSGQTSSSEPGPADAIREWERLAGDHFKQSAQALEQISKAADSGDADVVRAACQRLHDTNSIGLQDDLPTPDPELTAELQRMIDDMNIATHACLRFADSMRPEDATTYQEFLSRAVEHLGRAKTILNADLGKG